VSECTVLMLSGWVVATRNSSWNHAHAHLSHSKHGSSPNLWTVPPVFASSNFKERAFASMLQNLLNIESGHIKIAVKLKTFCAGGARFESLVENRPYWEKLFITFVSAFTQRQQDNSTSTKSMSLNFNSLFNSHPTVETAQYEVMTAS
jgi:hypothetical protein